LAGVCSHFYLRQIIILTEYIELNEEDERVHEAWRKAFSCLHLSSHIKSLSLLFYKSYYEHNEYFETMQRPSTAHLKLQWSLLQSLMDRPVHSSSLTSLRIDNLLPFDDDFYKSPHLLEFLSQLSCLGVDIFVDVYYDKKPRNEFYDTLSILFLRRCKNLRTLILDFSQPVGYAPFFRFNYLTFSQLASLTLVKVQFDSWGFISHHRFKAKMGTENMILRSRHTLEYLKLVNCEILNDEIQDHGFERRWADIWDNFSHELQVLRELGVYGMERVEDRYAYFDRENGSMPLFDELDGEERDRPALDRFCSIILSRQGGHVEID
jgi:hypothetical protein